MDSAEMTFHPELQGAVGTLLVVGVIGLGVLLWSLFAEAFIVSALALVGTPGILFLYSKYLEKTTYTVTEEKIMRDTKIFGHSHTEIPLHRIQNMNFSQSGLQSRLGEYGSIEISTAGSGSSEMMMFAIPDAEEVYNHISELSDSEGTSTSSNKFATVTGGESVAEEAKKLNEVSKELRSTVEGDQNE